MSVACADEDRDPLVVSTRDWPESNCYTDVWIELLRAQGLAPIAMLGCALGVEDELDQWTFFKPEPAALRALYGVDVVELTLWRDLETQLVTQVEAGRVPLVEVDAHDLPDSVGRDYHVSHTKTTIAVCAIDPHADVLEYIHNRTRGRVDGEDYRRLVRREPVRPAEDLPPYAELVKTDRLRRRDVESLRGIARTLLAERFETVCAANPVERYAERIERDVASLRAATADGDDDAFDRYAFANLRQLGAAHAFLADHLRWLSGDGAADRGPFSEAAAAFERVSGRTSALVLQVARVVHTGRRRDLAGVLGEIASEWAAGRAALARGLGQ